MIQELTAEQEDFLIEEGLERARENRGTAEDLAFNDYLSWNKKELLREYCYINGIEEADIDLFDFNDFCRDIWRKEEI